MLIGILFVQLPGCRTGIKFAGVFGVFACKTLLVGMEKGVVMQPLRMLFIVL
jgi:hypothetical protein